MNDDDLLRYSRQIMLPEVDLEGQQRLLNSRVLIIGMGGLGSPLAAYLAAAGVGCLAISDPDRVDLSNLQRQILHFTPDLGKLKTASAAETLQAINPQVSIEPLPRRLDGEDLTRQVEEADVVADCSDNFATRFALNAACVKARKPLVSGAAIRMQGQLSVFMPAQSGGPCYRCLYPEQGEEENRCSETGVLAPVVGVIGSLQAVETIKCLLGKETVLSGRLLLFDALRMEWQSIKLRRDPACPVCGPPNR